MSGISFTGVGSGIDTKTIVNALVAAEIAPQRQQLSTRKSSLDAQLSSFGRLRSALSEFQSTLNNLKSPERFQARTANVSNEDRFTAISSANAQTGDYQIAVLNLAKSQRLMTANSAFASASSVVGNGVIEIGVGGSYDQALGNGFTITIDNPNATLSDISRQINNAPGNNFVSASIINVDDGAGSQARLILTAKQPGVSNELTINVDEGTQPGLSALSSTNLEISRPAEDARLKVNGLDVTRSSNTISDVIQGVTLNLKAADPNEEVNLTIGTDRSAIEKNVQSFVDAYNKLQTVLRDISTRESSALRGDSTVRGLSSQIRILSSSEVTGLSQESSILAQVGVSIDKDGRMSLNSTTLNRMLDNDFASVSSLFTSEQGIANRLESFVKGYTQSGGLLENRTRGIDSRLRTIADQQDRVDVREENLFNRLSRQFNAMDSIVSQINANGSFLSAQLASMQMFR